MPQRDKLHMLRRQQALARPDLGTDGGLRRETAPAKGLTSAPVRLMPTEARRLIDEAIEARERAKEQADA